MCLCASQNDLAGGTGPTKLMQMLLFDYTTLREAFFLHVPSLTQVAQGAVAMLWVKAVFCHNFFFLLGKCKVICVIPTPR